MKRSCVARDGSASVSEVTGVAVATFIFSAGVTCCAMDSEDTTDESNSGEINGTMA